MEIVVFLLGAVFCIVGIVGSFLPVIPGAPISWVALLMLKLTFEDSFSWNFIVITAVITIVVFVLDYAIPIIGTKKFGGTKHGVRGSVIGLVLGIFFTPIGMILGSFLGAFSMEYYYNNDSKQAMKSAFGSFIGFLLGSGLKFIASSVFAYYFFNKSIDLIF